jgi:rhodanese-related sulfurtransferase
MTVDEVMDARRAGAVVLDTREAMDFAAGHLRGAINVGLTGRFAEYTGDVLRPDQDIVLVADPGTALEARVRLARIGFDRVVGVLHEPYRAFAEHHELVERSSRQRPDELDARRRDVPNLQLLDVRNAGETAVGGTIPGAVVTPLPRLVDALADLDPNAPTVTFCSGGYRSSLAASVLATHGFTDVSDLLGGYEAWRNLPVGT